MIAARLASKMLPSQRYLAWERNFILIYGRTPNKAEIAEAKRLGG